MCFPNFRGLYILDEDGNPQEEKDLLKWAKWKSENKEKCMIIRDYVGNVLISTVFLGINHGFEEQGEPILFETMIFEGNKSWNEMWRYTTREDAIEGHKEAVQFVKTKKRKV